MAKATKIPAITRTEVVEVAPAIVQLELSINEAKFIAAILAKIAGNPDHSLRRYQPSISDALERVGISVLYPVCELGITDSIYCHGSSANPKDFTA